MSAVIKLSVLVRGAFVAAVIAICGGGSTAQATDLNMTANNSGDASSFDPVNIPGGYWGTSGLRLGNGASGIAITITNGTLYGSNGSGVTGALQINGNNNTLRNTAPRFAACFVPPPVQQ